jgi:hypothetical protein
MASEHSEEVEELEDNPRKLGDINQPWTWTTELAENPQWLWMSHQWIAAERVPEFLDPIPEHWEEQPPQGPVW